MCFLEGRLTSLIGSLPRQNYNCQHRTWVRATSRTGGSQTDALGSKTHAKTGPAVRAKESRSWRKKDGGGACAPQSPAITTCLKINSEPGYGAGEHRNAASSPRQLLLWGNHGLARSPHAWAPVDHGQLLRKHKNTVESPGEETFKWES